MAAIEPFTSHTGQMNVWTVEAVSRDSGVSGDPAQDVVKDTALGTYFWCDGMERRCSRPR
ncbi:M64 family metallopeptidase [Streptomyces sp. NRRL S-1868]|uniref:M64 family metallopeptidase n=1 Tax=Streptomyces sp. NRRL S-1868 TaxID=1463892 RepID=UPI000A3EFAFF|nr:M64 family metallopeptidase [Streptomyces sp. NRRL S-1868]